MSDSLFIDGLKPRSEKDREKFFSSAKSYRDPTGVKPKNAQTPPISNRSASHVNHIAVEFQDENNLERKPESYENSIKHSYAHDILGIDDDELNLDTEDLRREKRAKKLAKKAEKRERKKSKNKKFIFRHKILSFIVTPILILTLVAYFWGDSLIARITNGRSGLFDLIRTVVAGNAKLKTGADGRTNILIFGTSGYDMSGSEGNGTHDGAQLTDSIMVLSIDQAMKDMAMISLPRDLKTGSCGVGKINEVYQCANRDGKHEQDGANALKSRVSDVLGIDIEYYAHINWMSLIQIVDQVGGITVTTDEDIDDDWTKTYIKAGRPVYLDGERALALARARHGTASGDFSRSASQQKILIALKEKISSKNMNIMDLVNLANILGDNLRSDFDTDTIYAGAKLLSSTSFEAIRQIPLTGEGNYYLVDKYINGISYIIPADGINNYDGIRKYIKEALQKNLVVLENANLLILNGSGVAGVAAKEQEELKSSVFHVKGIGDAPSGNYFERVYIYNITNKTATKERLEKYYNTKAIDGSLLPNGIDVSGVDFVIILGIGYSAD